MTVSTPIQVNTGLTTCCDRDSHKRVCNTDVGTIYSDCGRWLRQRGGRKPAKLFKNNNDWSEANTFHCDFPLWNDFFSGKNPH